MASIVYDKKTDRPRLLLCASYCLGILTLQIQPLGSVLAAEPLVIENASYRVEVDRLNGVVSSITDKVGKLQLIKEPRLADNFRFTLPLRGSTAWQSTEANFVLGRDQRLTSHEQEANRLVLRWDGPLTSVFGQDLDVSAGMEIQFVDASSPVAPADPQLAGAVHFDFWIDNRTSLEIGEVYAPILGGVCGIGTTAEELRRTDLILPTGAGRQNYSVFHTFSNMSWLGIHGPEQYYSYPDVLSMPWGDLYQADQQRGFYFGLHDEVARYKLLHLELSPGISGPRIQGNWPTVRESGGLPVGVKLSAVYMPYLPGHQRFNASTLVLAAHQGDWNTAARLYGDWYRRQFAGDPDPPSWMNTTVAVRECPRIAYRDLPAWARQCAQKSVGELLLTDWKRGGHGDGMPRFEIDPNLGSREDFIEAIRQCHELGLRVTTRVNLQPVSRQSEWYRRELQPFANIDRWGIVATQLGWGHGGTLTNSFSSGERRVWLGVSSEHVRQQLVTQMCELARCGVDGIHLSDFFARPLDFNPTSGKTADRATWEGGLECLQAIRDECQTIRPGFGICIDSAWDQLRRIGRSLSVDSPIDSPLREAIPSLRMSYLVSEPDDFRTVNDAIRMGGRLRLAFAVPEPLGGTAAGNLMDYLEIVMRAQQILQHTLLEGHPVQTSADLSSLHIESNRFENAESGMRSVVLVNSDPEPKQLPLTTGLNGAHEPFLVWQPSQGLTTWTAPTTLTIPGEELAILTNEPVGDSLAKLPKWHSPVSDRRQQVVVEFRAAGDLQGWTLEGTAFSVDARPPLFRKPSLNSLARAGESAVGVALSPPFEFAAEFDRMEIVFHGAAGERTSRGPNLALRVLDAESNDPLMSIIPPNTHVLTTQTIPLGDLRGRTVRLQLVDENTGVTYAWLGLRKVTLVGPAQ